MRTRLRLKTAIATFTLAFASHALAGPNDMTGTIRNVAATPAGFLFTLGVSPPANCANAYQGWLLVPESNKSMTAFALLAWQNQLRITIYAAGIDSATGYCRLDSIVQLN